MSAAWSRLDDLCRGNKASILSSHTEASKGCSEQAANRDCRRHVKAFIVLRHTKEIVWKEKMPTIYYGKPISSWNQLFRFCPHSTKGENKNLVNDSQKRNEWIKPGCRKQYWTIPSVYTNFNTMKCFFLHSNEQKANIGRISSKIIKVLLKISWCNNL